MKGSGFRTRPCPARSGGRAPPGCPRGRLRGLLVGLAAFTLAYTPSYDLLDQLPGDVESVEAFDTMQRGFPAGALNPTQVYVHRDDGRPLTDQDLAGVADALAGAEGVGTVSPPEPSADGATARIPLLLEDSPLSNAAMDAVRGPVRDAAHAAAPAGTTVLVGGTSSTFADLASAYDDDLRLILPVAAVLIALVLGLLVRSLVAPWYLMAAVMATFAASLGVGVLAIQLLGGASGLIFFLPILLYLFVIAAAALILAGTFSALLTAGVGFLTQFGLSVAVGILLAAVMATLLVPGLTALIGRAAWWPRAGRRAASSEAPAPGTALSAARPEPRAGSSATATG